MKAKITANFENLCSSTTFSPELLIKLNSQDMITDSQRETIANLSNSADKALFLYTILKNKPDSFLPQLIQALKTTGNQKPAEYLETELIPFNTAYSSSMCSNGTTNSPLAMQIASNEVTKLILKDRNLSKNWRKMETILELEHKDFFPIETGINNTTRTYDDGFNEAFSAWISFKAGDATVNNLLAALEKEGFNEAAKFLRNGCNCSLDARIVTRVSN